MSESIFASIIDEMAERDLARYAEISAFKTTKKHDRAMQRIFKRYERNTRRLRPQNEIRVRNVQKRIIVALVVIILAVFTGFTAAYFISRSFQGEVHKDNTELFPIDMENGPTVIEDKYYLSELPEGFEEDYSDTTPYYKFIRYENRHTGQTITFKQWTKSYFDPVHYNAKTDELEEVDINEHCGIFLDLSNDELNRTLLIWDNGDYIIEISGKLSKEDMIDLAKSAKIIEN